MRFLLSILAALCFVTGSLPAASAYASFTAEERFGPGMTVPVAWADYNDDGRLDLALGNYNQPNKLYTSDGNGSFTETSQFGSGATFAVSWADYDNDGDSDVAVANGLNQQNRLFVNEGGGVFTGEEQFGLNASTSVAWADYDLDGDLDLAVGNGILGPEVQNYLYINNGDGTFTAEPQFGTGRTGTLVWGDIDGDGDPDLAVGNGGFGWIGQNYLYVNNGDGSFTEHPAFGLGDTSTLAWGDADNDGDLDLAVGNWDAGQNYLYVNNGDGSFVELARFGARDPNTIAWGDADNDGDLDLAVGNGDFQSAEQNYLYINNDDGTFTELPDFGLGSTDAVAWGDYDNDGDLDLAVGNEHTPFTNYLYVNNENDEEWLVVHLVGHFHDAGNGFSNRDAVGAKVAAYEAGYIGYANHCLGHREIEAHGGFASQNAIDAHFGAPGVSAVDLRIIWPGSNGKRIVQLVEGLLVGQRYVIDETGAPSDVASPGPVLLDQGFLRVSPNPMHREARIELVSSFSAGQGLLVCNLAGRIVRTLPVSGPDGNGRWQAAWNGRMRNGEPAPAGVYLMRELGGGGSTARVLLLR